MKILIIEDNLPPFSIINCKLALDERVSEIGIYDYLNNPVNEDMTHFINRDNGGHSFELFWVKSHDEFLDMVIDIHSFDLIILDFELKIGNSKPIAHKILELEFDGEIIPHSSKSEHNDTLRNILNVDTKNFCKVSGEVACYLVEQLESIKKGA